MAVSVVTLTQSSSTWKGASETVKDDLDYVS